MQKFQNLAESLPLMVWTCRGSDGACTYLSPQWAAYTGFSVDDQLGARWLERLHPDDLEATRAAWRSALEGASFSVEHRIRRHDGVYRWFTSRAVRVREQDGNDVWYGSHTDVQDLKDARAAVEASVETLSARVAARTDELEAALARAASLAHDLAEAQRVAQTGSWSYDARRHLVRWSAELFRIYGIDPEAGAVPFDQQHKLYVPSSWQALHAAVVRCLETGEAYALTLHFVRSDGSRGVGIARGQATGPDRTALVGTFQDITERELTAASLSKNEERLQLATSAARMGIWEWHVPSDALVWDDGMYALYGIDRASFSGAADAWRAALHPDDVEATRAAIAAAVAGTAPFDLHFRILRPGGEVRHVHGQAVVTRDETGAAQRVIGVNHDVTERRVAELALRGTLALQRGVLRHAGSAIVGTDIRGAITLWNNAAEEMLGWRAADVIGVHSPLLIHDPDEVAVRRAHLEAAGYVVDSPFATFVAKALRDGADASEWTYVRKDGSRLPVLLTVTALRDDDNAVTGFLGVAVDLSQRKRTETELRELNRLLEERSAQREVLLQEVHHRVKNNLQVIASLMNLQLRQLAEPAARAALEDCRARVQSIALIHEQLYTTGDFARLPLDEYVRQLVRNVVAAGAPAAGRVQLSLDLTRVLVPVEKAIPCGLILNELVANALKHAFPGERRGTVHVALAVNDGAASLTVADDGVGGVPALPEAASSSLGLLLVDTLVGQLGATLTVARETGTTFHITFPLEHGP